MKRRWICGRIFVRGVFCAVAMVFLMGTASAPVGSGAIPDLSRRINDFSVDLLKQCARDDGAPANLVISPQSVFQGLAMSYIASGGETRKELATVLHFPEDNRSLMKKLGKLRSQIDKSAKGRGIDVSMANAVWMDTTYAEFRKSYIKDLGRTFAASLRRVDFADKKRACAEINDWIARQTRNRIREGVGPADLASKSRPGVIDEPGLVAVNAVYFHADWGSRFDKAATRKAPFRTGAGATVRAAMMHQNSMLICGESKTHRFLELPYIDDRYSMYVILPQKALPVSELLGGITARDVVDLKLGAIPRMVDVLLPKFRVSTRRSMKNSLSRMGVKAAFDSGKANFDKMIVKNPDAHRIYISSIRHDAWIDVNEKGTEAAAATTTTHYSFGCSADVAPAPVEFHADHPFLFMIVHNPSRSILFAGWISDPEK